jgi:hypothetical protein
MNTPENCLIIGLDGAVPEVIEKYSKQGYLPNISKLIENGAWADNCLPPLPNTSPTCWATIATGASPATHGVTSSNLYDHKLPLTETYPHAGYSSDSIKADTLWQAAERAGLRSLLISFPTSWPPKTSGVQIGTTDTSATDGSFGIKHQLFSTEDIPASLKISVEKARNSLRGQLTPELDPGYWIVDEEACKEATQIEPFSWTVEISKENEVLLSVPNAPGKRLVKLRKGEWSKDLRITVQTARGSRD